MDTTAIVQRVCLVIVAVSLVAELAFGLMAIWLPRNDFPIAECAWTAGLFMLVGVGGLVVLKLLL